MKATATTLAETGMNIGKLAKASGVNAKLIRYYESIDLLPPAGRTEAGYRQYSHQDIERLRFIRRARALGFGMPEIRQLLSLWQNEGRASADVKQLALQHIQDLESRIAEMQTMVSVLSALAQSCHGDNSPDCPILENLAAATGLSSSGCVKHPVNERS